jgi:hypothetical protein
MILHIPRSTVVWWSTKIILSLAPSRLRRATPLLRQPAVTKSIFLIIILITVGFAAVDWAGQGAAWSFCCRPPPLIALIRGLSVSLRPLPAPARPSVLVVPCLSASLFSRHTYIHTYPLTIPYLTQSTIHRSLVRTTSSTLTTHSLAAKRTLTTHPTLPLYPYCAVGEAGSLNTGWV